MSRLEESASYQLNAALTPLITELDTRVSQKYLDNKMSHNKRLSAIRGIPYEPLPFETPSAEYFHTRGMVTSEASQGLGIENVTHKTGRNHAKVLREYTFNGVTYADDEEINKAPYEIRDEGIVRATVGACALLTMYEVPIRRYPA
jgi:hypothetical protein